MKFNAIPTSLGKAFDINGHLTTVIGVLSASFDFGAVFAPGTKVDANHAAESIRSATELGNIITMIGAPQTRDHPRSGRAKMPTASRPSMCWNNKYPGFLRLIRSA